MRVRRFAQVTGAVAWRNVHNFVTQKELLLPPLLFPLFFFSAFAGGLSAVEKAPGFDYPGGYTMFQFGFVVLQAAAMGGVFAGFGMARDWEIGFGRRLMLAAPQRTALIAGYALAACVRAAVVIAFVFMIALVTGMDVFARPSYLLAIVLLGLMFNVVGSFWASGVALRFRSLQAGPLMQMPVFMILFIAPVYVPEDMLVGWVEAGAAYNPVTVVINAVRNLLVDSTDEVAAAFGVLTLMALVLFVWARTGMSRAEAAGG